MDTNHVCAGERVALLVNNLGSATALEMGVACRAAVRCLTDPGRAGGALVLRRVWVGTFMTSLDMKGVSLSVMRLGADSALEAALDAPTQVGGRLAGAPAGTTGFPRLGCRRQRSIERSVQRSIQRSG